MGSPNPSSPLATMFSSAFPPRRPSAFLRFLVPAVLLLLCFYYLSGSPIPAPYNSETNAPEHSSEHKQEEAQPGQENTQAKQPPAPPPQATSNGAAQTLPTGSHPIDALVRAAESDFSTLMSKQSKSLGEAAAAYRKRRGRHPPPGFNKWYEFAKEHDAVIVEEFWDQIYHDLEPFWALPAPLLRKEAREFEMTINIRGGNATAGSDWFWTKIWLKMIKTIEHLLPDMDLALNAMDEPRLVVPWENVNEYMTAAAETRSLKEPQSVVSEFGKLPDPGDSSDTQEEQIQKKDWESEKHYWKIARRGCPPDSLARKAGIMTDFDHVPVISSDLPKAHMQDGYVSNYTKSTEFCHQPDLQGLNGIFVEPLSTKATKVFFPMFGGSKLAVNNEILLPAPMYWNEEERFTGGEFHGGPWAEKKDQVVWRGVATGGRNRENNWRAFQRHRFIAMNNGTKLTRAEQWTEALPNFALPSKSYGLKSQEQGRLGEWVGTWTNVSFVDLMCSPKQDDGSCPYTEPHFNKTKGLKLKTQYNFKYLPDVDGNSFSGRYLAFLRSTSLPIKATLWREWHDSRLVAWKHFVPMDNRYSEWYAIMEYFLGYKEGNVPGHDAVAERIASQGKEWAEKVLRKEDMQIYVLRLLLEYARVSDERRENMGWVEDLLGSQDPTA